MRHRDVSRDEAQTYFITNRAEGATADFPKPERVYNAFTVFYQKTFGGGAGRAGELHALVPPRQLRRSLSPGDGPARPGSNSDFDLSRSP